MKKPKNAKWIWIPYEENNEIGHWYCSNCYFMPSSFNLAVNHLKYCANCGAKMKGLIKKEGDEYA